MAHPICASAFHDDVEERKPSGSPALCPSPSALSRSRQSRDSPPFCPSNPFWDPRSTGSATHKGIRGSKVRSAGVGRPSLVGLRPCGVSTYPRLTGSWMTGDWERRAHPPHLPCHSRPWFYTTYPVAVPYPNTSHPASLPPPFLSALPARAPAPQPSPARRQDMGSSSSTCTRCFAVPHPWTVPVAPAIKLSLFPAPCLSVISECKIRCGINSDRRNRRTTYRDPSVRQRQRVSRPSFYR